MEKKEKSKTTKKTTSKVKSKTKVEKKPKVEKEQTVKKVKIQEEDIFNTPTKKGIYYSFNMRVITNVILLVVFVCALVYSSIMSFSITKRQYINYNENSDIDYKIYLKDNNFYDEKYLGKGMAYVASLIDKIHINYKYNFNVDKKSNLYVIYDVKAKVIIASQSNSNTFFEKEYNLSEEKIEEVNDEYGYSISKNDVVIDYNYYNKLANDFKAHYAVNTSNRLEVTLYVTEKSKPNNIYNLSNTNKVTLIIPLSEQEVNISFDNKNVNIEKQLISNPAFIVKDTKLAIVSGVLAILALAALVGLMKKLSLISPETSKYDKYVNRILRGYDRLIISIKNKPNVEEYNIIKVERFEELIDVRDNTSQPINYFVVTPHQKCEFFVINKNNLYTYVVKASEFEKDSNNEKES